MFIFFNILHFNLFYLFIFLNIVSNLKFQNPPWQILTLNETGHVIKYKGLVFDIIKELSKRLNFTYTVHLTKQENLDFAVNKSDNSLAEITNSIPDDIIEIIRSKKAIIGACGFTINNQKKDVINFTNPISIQVHTFLVARPRQLSRALLFIRPFTYDVSI